MDILVVGGSSFVGRHITEAAVAAGHRVLIANRGVTSTETFGAEALLKVDRDSADLAAVKGRAFDAVLDVSAYVPRVVAQLADVLGDVGRYVFVSTVSVYSPSGLREHDDESGALREPVAEPGDRGRELYGELKVACEQVAAQRWGDRLTVVRPGVVAGPHDTTDRFTWWTRHLAEDANLELPDRRQADDPAAHVQVVDGRDLAAFVLRLAEHDVAGTFDAAGEPHRLDQFVDRIREGVGSQTAISWTAPTEWDADALPPLVLHADWGQDGIFSRSSAAALAAGLVRRLLSETARDTRRWDVVRGLPDLSV